MLNISDFFIFYFKVRVTWKQLQLQFVLRGGETFRIKFSSILGGGLQDMLVMMMMRRMMVRRRMTRMSCITSVIRCKCVCVLFVDTHALYFCF